MFMVEYRECQELTRYFVVFKSGPSAQSYDKDSFGATPTDMSPEDSELARVSEAKEIGRNLERCDETTQAHIAAAYGYRWFEGHRRALDVAIPKCLDDGFHRHGGLALLLSGLSVSELVSQTVKAGDAHTRLKERVVDAYMQAVAVYRASRLLNGKKRKEFHVCAF